MLNYIILKKALIHIWIAIKMYQFFKHHTSVNIMISVEEQTSIKQSSYSSSMTQRIFLYIHDYVSLCEQSHFVSSRTRHWLDILQTHHTSIVCWYDLVWYKFYIFIPWGGIDISVL